MHADGDKREAPSVSPPEEHTQLQTEPFHLGPQFEKEKHQFYVSQLVQSLKDNRNTNIALSGPYGSGKSSILQGLAEQLANKNQKDLQIRPIFISLSSFNLDQSTGPEESVNSLQREILKQLLVREDPLRIPRSRYRGIPIVPWWRKGITYALTASLTLIIYGLFLDADAPLNWLSDSEVLPANAGLGVVLKLFVLFVLICLIAFAIDYSIINKPTIKAITVGPGKLELGNGDESYFDKYLAEIVYYFRISKVNLVIFEDLDRFESPAIFESLHKLNNQVNAAIATKSKHQSTKRTVKFIYAIRDSIFSLDPKETTDQILHNQFTTPEENRTKFFDFILPVVPFSTHRNAYEFLYMHLDRVGLAGQIDRDLINTIGAHVIDHRLLLNIVYEFAVFRHHILKDASDNKLLAMISYKNTNLSDFEAISRGQSNLDHLTKEFTDFTRTQQLKVQDRLRALEVNQNTETGDDLFQEKLKLREFFLKTRSGSIKNLQEFLQHQQSDSYTVLSEARKELDTLIQSNLGVQSLGASLTQHGYIDTDFYLYVSAFTEGLNTSTAQLFLINNVNQINPAPYLLLDEQSLRELAVRLHSQPAPILAGAANSSLLIYLAGRGNERKPSSLKLITKILRDAAKEDNADSLIPQLIHALLLEIDNKESDQGVTEVINIILRLCATEFPNILSDSLYDLLTEEQRLIALNTVLGWAPADGTRIASKFQHAIEENYAKIPILSSDDADHNATANAIALLTTTDSFPTDLVPLNDTAVLTLVKKGTVQINSSNLRQLTERLKINPSLVSLARFPALLETVADNPDSYVKALHTIGAFSITTSDIGILSAEVIPTLCDYLFNKDCEDTVQEASASDTLTTLFSASERDVYVPDIGLTDSRSHRALLQAGLAFQSLQNAWTYFENNNQVIDFELKSFLEEIAYQQAFRANETLVTPKLLALAKAVMKPTTWDDGEQYRERILRRLGPFDRKLDWSDLGELTPEKIHTAQKVSLVSSDSPSNAVKP